MESDVIKIGFEPHKVVLYSKSALLSSLILCTILMYFFSVSEMSDAVYQKIHTLFITTVIIGAFLMCYLKTFNSFISISIMYISYFILNNMRYIYVEVFLFFPGFKI